MRSLDEDLDRARPGDWLEAPTPGGGPPRVGQIVELLGGPGHRRFLVRWDEEHETLHYPSPADRLRPAERAGRTGAARRGPRGGDGPG